MTLLFFSVFTLICENIITFGAMNGVIKRIIKSFPAALIICYNLSASDIRVSEIQISGNKKTKEFTILRELPFRKGDAIPINKLGDQLRVTEENLNNTSLFNYVYVNYKIDTMNISNALSCTVIINVEERWYYWPQISLKFEDRNLNSWLKEKDWDRITFGWGLRIYNVFGLRHKVTASNYLGYEKGGRIAYYNIALDKKRTKMLSLGLAALFNKTLNVYSKQDKVVYAENPDKFLEQSINSTLTYSYRPEIRTTHSLNLQYRNTAIKDTILAINKDYWGSTSLTNNTFKASYLFNYEHRNYIAYPTTGYYASAEIAGTTADKFRFFHGQINLKMHYYKNIYPRIYWSSRLNASTSFKNKHAYIYDQNVGYGEHTITGYDYYVIDGQHHTILNNDFRFLLMPKKIVNLGLNGLPKFSKIHFSLYAKIMYDIGYVHNCYKNETNSLANTFLWGSGIALDLVTYYDIVLSCSYAVNKIGKSGFYFGIKAPIF